MTINPKLWPLITQLSSATVLTLLCMFMYNNGFVPKDAMLLIGNSLALYIVNLLKQVNNKQNEVTDVLVYKDH